MYTITINDTTAPTVKEVAFNGADLEIKFSEPILSDVTSTKTTIVRVNGNPVVHTPQADGDVKIVVPAAQLTSVVKGATATIYVAGVTDVAGNEMTLYNGSFVKPNDTTKPAVTGVTQVGQNVVRIEFSEALTDELTTGEVTVLKGARTYTDSDVAQGSTIVVAKNTDDSTGKTYDVTIDLGDGAGAAAGTPNYGIYAAGSDSQAITILIPAESVADAAGNKNEDVTRTVTLNRDKEGPQYKSHELAADKETVNVTFDEEFVDGAANIDESKIIVTNSDGVRFAVEDATTIANSTNSKVLEIDFVAGANAIKNGTYTITIQEGAIEDAYGNLNAAVTFKVTVGAASDTTKPVATLDGSSAVNKFVIDFGEEVTNTALNLNNYKLDGSVIKNAVIYFNDTDKEVVTIELAEGSINFGNASAGTDAVLNVSGVKDLAGNVVNSTNLTVKVGDNTAATIVSVQVMGQDVYVTFNEALDVPATTDAGSIFTLKDNNSDVTAGDVSAVAGNAKQVKFTLDSALTGSLDVKVTAGQTALTDTNGVAVK